LPAVSLQNAPRAGCPILPWIGYKSKTFHIAVQRDPGTNKHGDPDSTGTVTGALHRGFVDLKTAITSRDNLAVLEECERGEDAAVSAYQEALREDLPDNVCVLLEQQYEGAKQNHNRVRKLRDTAELYSLK
jgi:uncharacterized protein DUF2383